MTDQITLVKPRGGWFDFGLKNIWLYRDLLLIFAMRDIKVRYKQTLLGPAWMLLQPLALTVVFTAMISGVAGVSTAGLPAPMFYLTGLIIWSYFSQTVYPMSQVFLMNEQLFSKIYFPRIIVPISSLLSNAVALAIQFVAVLVFLAWYKMSGELDGPVWRILLFPLVIFQVAALSLGVGLCLAASTSRYRDMSHVTPFMLQLWMFVTPIIYPFSAVPEGYRLLLSVVNPLAVLVEQSRWCFVGRSAVEFQHIGAALVGMAAFLAVGVLLFQRVERVVVDTI
jgi:lipopolysaccharide transport system permease protein